MRLEKLNFLAEVGSWQKTKCIVIFQNAICSRIRTLEIDVGVFFFFFFFFFFFCFFLFFFVVVVVVVAVVVVFFRINHTQF